MSYKRGVQSSVLPAVPADADRVPEPYLLQIVKKPKVRADRKPITRFKLLTPTNQVDLITVICPLPVHRLTSDLMLSVAVDTHHFRLMLCATCFHS